jgi:hypothetical protein
MHIEVAIMQSGKSLVLDESKDIENPETPLLVLSDIEKYEKLSFIKTSLLGFDTTTTYFGSCLGINKLMYCIVPSGAFGLLATFVGGGILLGTAVNSNPNGFTTSTFLELGALTGAGMVSSGASCALLLSAKCRAHILGKMNRPISLPHDFKLDELNQLLYSVGLEPLKAMDISSTKNLKGILKIIDTAIEHTEKYRQLKMGEAVISALPNIGFFSGRGRLILSYLISNEEIVERLTPMKQSKN